jgi:hypothetical protein
MGALVLRMLCFPFLLCSGAMGYCLLTNPVRLAEGAERLGIYIRVLDYCRTKAGRIQLRALGAVFLLVSILMLAVVASAMVGP